MTQSQSALVRCRVPGLPCRPAAHRPAATRVVLAEHESLCRIDTTAQAQVSPDSASGHLQAR